MLAALPAAFSAVFAAATASMGALSHARKAALRDLGGPAGAALGRYLENDSAIESRWLVLRVMGVAISCWFLGQSLPADLGDARLALGVLGAVLVYGVPAEALRVVTTRTADRSAPLLLRLLRPLELLAAPLAAPMVLMGSLVSRVVSAAPHPDDGVTETEVELIVSEGEMNGSLDSEQSKMILNVLDFRELTAGEVMVPRTRVTSFDVEAPTSEVLAQIVQSGHSRYPIYRERVDNVVGVLHVKDLMHKIASGASDIRIEDVMRKPVVFVPETQHASDVLRDMRVGRHHMSVVIDEFGGVAGIVTLEDLIEQIVGEIRDEHDAEEPKIVDLGNGRLLVDAGITIVDLSRQLGAELPEGKDYNSLGGFIVDQLGRLPRVGATLNALGYEFVVREADERHVSKVEIVLPPSKSKAPSLSPRSSRMTAA